MLPVASTMLPFFGNKVERCFDIVAGVERALGLLYGPTAHSGTPAVFAVNAKLSSRVYGGFPRNQFFRKTFP